MASIRKLKSGNFQAQIRLSGLPKSTKSFSKKKGAITFSNTVEGDTGSQGNLGKATSQVPSFWNWCDVYKSQYSGRDPGTDGRLDWWWEQFGEIPVTREQGTSTPTAGASGERVCSGSR